MRMTVPRHEPVKAHRRGASSAQAENQRVTIARTSRAWGFSLAVSGITRPDAVVCSASLDLTTMRSSRGLMETDTCDLPFGNVEDGQELERELHSMVRSIRRLTGRPPSRGRPAHCTRLALAHDEC